MSTRPHLLVTNDFPPKVGGIQAYLWELWSRLDPASAVVLTASSHSDHAAFDAEQAARGLRIVRVPSRILFFPTPAVLRRVRDVAREVDASLVLFDPAWPLGLLGPRLDLPYGVILHGAEVTAPARLPLVRPTLAHVLRHAALVVSAGGYPAAEARRATGGDLRTVVEIPPGVDCQRFAPLPLEERRRARASWGVGDDDLLVVSVSRLVPRKGMDVLIEALNLLRPQFDRLTGLIAGDGRDGPRLRRLVARTGAPVRLIGRVSEEEKAALLGAADVFVMACRNRWLGLEQEGFGIVFLEAAAAGVPQVVGASGGAAEAVADGQTGIVVDRPDDPAAVARALGRLLEVAPHRRGMGTAARRRALASFDYGRLAPRLAAALADVEG